MVLRPTCRGTPSDSTCSFASRSLCAVVGLLVIVSFSSNCLAKKNPPAHPIDLNTATVKELEQLPGVGPTTARAIVDFRSRGGHFRRVTDLLVIRGISEAKLKKMRPYITVGLPPKKSP